MEVVASRAPRVLAVDVLRGLVLFVLLPDLAGGFSFYAVAQALPDSTFWRALATQFRHVDWTGVAVWDLVMPLFVFMVGVSMALSHLSRKQSEPTPANLLWRAALRSAALFLLGMLLQFKAERRVDELLPLLVLSTGLPVGRWWNRVMHSGQVRSPFRADSAYSSLILLLVGAWVCMHYEQLGHYEIGSQILALLGLAYFPAFLLQRFRLRTQGLVAAALLAVYGMAFHIYAAVQAGGRMSAAAWQPAHNLGAAFDTWLFALLPRAQPYAGNPHDYHSLLFVPLISAIVFGAIVGRVLGQQGPSRRLATRLCATALFGLVLSGVMSLTVAPLLKSLWTPSWGIFSSSACLLMLGALMLLLGESNRWRWTTPLVVLGTNSMLLYVLAFTQRWRIVNYWDRFLSDLVAYSFPWWPLVQSCLVLATWWLLAFSLYRSRIFIRL